MLKISTIEKFVKLISKDGDYMHVILFICGIAHFGYLGLFYYLGIDEMVYFNFVSVTIYLIVLILSRKGQYKTAYVLTYLEILIHQFFGIYMLGLDSGFDLLLCCLFLFQFSFFDKRTCLYLTIFLFVAIYSHYFIDEVFVFSGKYTSNSNFENIENILYYINEAVLIVFITIYAILASLVSTNKIDNLKYIIYHDVLTGLCNRKYLEDMIIPNIEKELTLICLCDIDNFKKINDEKGHDIGDIVLKRLGFLFGKFSSDMDIEIIRWGGEEFLICAKTKSLESSVELLQNLQSKINQNHIRQINGNITMTFGGVFIKNPKSSDFKKYFKIADEILYEGKNNGKNMIKMIEL